MNNFLNFILRDIENKKNIISTLPVNTKINKRKYNEKIDVILKKYNEYKNSLKKYLDTKSKSFLIPNSEKDIDKLNEEVSKLEKVKFILNPTNTFFEKMGFDNLMYKISNYNEFDFLEVNSIIDEFVEKFNTVGIVLSEKEFDITIYVNEYMKNFLELKKQNKSYESLQETFEKIYWINPDLVSHIELNFKKIINKYKNKFINYIEDIRKKELLSNDIKDYNDCLIKLKIAYKNLYLAEKENIHNIIDYSLKGIIDINQYFEESKVRIATYENMSIKPLNFDDKKEMDNFYKTIEKYKMNLEEYNNYLVFIPLINDFKEEYKKHLADNSKINDIELKKLQIEIKNKENKLDKINKKIFGKSLFNNKNEEATKKLKMDSIVLANELYTLYNNYNLENFKIKALSIVNNLLTLPELLHLYYSYDYFKKVAIKKVYNLTSYQDLVKYSDDFDLFSMNANNIIINGINVFDDEDMSKIIANKYRLSNINVNESELTEDGIPTIINNIKMLLRINTIENSNITIEKIWFITEVQKITDIENK